MDNVKDQNWAGVRMTGTTTESKEPAQPAAALGVDGLEDGGKTVQKQSAEGVTEDQPKGNTTAGNPELTAAKCP